MPRLLYTGNSVGLTFIASVFLCLLLHQSTNLYAQESYVSTSAEKGYFPIVSANGTAAIFVDANEDKGILRAAEDLKLDIERVTGVVPALHLRAEMQEDFLIIVGSLGNSELIESLVESGKLDAGKLRGRETFVIQTVEAPFPGVSRALVIAGSDKRGTIFGIYDLSREIGVSPWHYWADVPAKKSTHLFVKPGIHSKGSPKVKYRGIFINDEAPALAGWATENFGGFNSQFYEHVFELILRLQGNFLWPAMWGRAFYDDDPLNPQLADQYGVVIGTSHHEPMMRAHDEWRRFGEGDWNYETNPEALQEFWSVGIERMGDYESVVTVGMRGDGDEPMTEETAIDLLEGIVRDQRDMIREVTGRPAEETPQVWALYKEVQDYYDQGMRVPEDVTLLLADDNWGNIRKLPDPQASPREGGYGIYYHYDYVGGPRNYKWINTTQISRVWEQMNLAHTFGADELWIVNVGDIKPMEYPTSFFLDYAWDPTGMGPDDLWKYTRDWAAGQLEEKQADDIADILLQYTKFNSRRKPELLDPNTYSLTNFNEADRVLKDYKDLERRAEDLYNQTSEQYKDAFFQLVLFPVQASANLNELYIAAAKNRLYAQQGRASADFYASEVRRLFNRDAELTRQYHEELADGKWNHMMSQTHIGYTYWQQPEENVMPEVKQVENSKGSSMGISVQGTQEAFADKDAARLPLFDPFNDQKYFVDVFNRGSKAFSFRIEDHPEWLVISQREGQIDQELRLWVEVDWDKAPAGLSAGVLKIAGAGSVIEVEVPLRNPSAKEIRGFVEADGYISMEASSFTENHLVHEAGWVEIPNLGRTGSGMASFPFEPTQQELSLESPYLSYDFHNFYSGNAQLELLVSPTLDFRNQGGLRFAISIDEQEPQIINIHQDTDDDWGATVSNNITSLHTSIKLEPGNHSLKIWALETGVVLQKIIIWTDQKKGSYLGPPENAFVELLNR